MQQYSQFFNGKLEIAKHYVPNKLDLNILERFQASREKVLVISDRFLTNAEDQLDVLYNSLVLPAEEEKKQEKSVVPKDSSPKSIKPRVQNILKKSHVLLATLLNKIWEELRAKEFNKERVFKAVLALKEKVQSLETLEDLQILSEMANEFLYKRLWGPSKGLILEIKGKFNKEDVLKIIEEAKKKGLEIKDMALDVYDEKIKVYLQKDKAKELLNKAIEFGNQEVVKGLKSFDPAKQGKEIVSKSRERSLELYNLVKKELSERKKGFLDEFHERKVGKKLKEKCEEKQEELKKEEMHERQEKMLQDLEEEREEIIKEKLLSSSMEGNQFE